METVEISLRTVIKYVTTFFKWIVLSMIMGVLGGFIGSLFHISVEYVTEFRMGHNWIICLLPIGGLLIVKLYNLCKVNPNLGTNQIISSIRSDEKVTSVTAPLIFISTVITHLLGGSAGREGAALQLGGSIGNKLGRMLKLDEKDMHVITMVGMSSVFSALFGTPLTAIFFSMEVISVGIIYYVALVPCMIASMIAYRIALHFNIAPIDFAIHSISNFSVSLILKVAIIAMVCAAVSILFCVIMHKTEKKMSDLIANPYKRIVIGGVLIVILTLIFRTNDYNGAGMDIIQKAFRGEVVSYAFLLKIIFTAITIGAGFKGGEIVPTFFIGATLGCFLGNILGVPNGLGAAIGLISLFCGVVNTPIATIFLSIELFGEVGLVYFAVAVGVSYMLSGYYGLYSSQKIVYSKLRAEYINTSAK